MTSSAQLNQITSPSTTGKPSYRAADEAGQERRRSASSASTSASVRQHLEGHGQQRLHDQLQNGAAAI